MAVAAANAQLFINAQAADQLAVLSTCSNVFKDDKHNGFKMSSITKMVQRG